MRAGSFDLLLPVVDGEKDLFFTQVGIRRSNQYSDDYRNTVNLGAGYRRTFDEWLIGGNAFYDRDLTGKNARLGLGAEAWSDNLKLSANGYMRLTDWRKSADVTDYLERPANGWDVRAEAYLPMYPQLAGKLMYEQYYGDEVALFGTSKRMSNPSATTVGISYTPIPLVTLATDYKQGRDGISETSVRLGLNYQLGVDIKKQLSPASIIARNSLANARYNLVNRNNEIVLDYKKDDSGSIALPAELRSMPLQTVTFPVTVAGVVTNITWSGTASSFAAPYNNSGTGTIVYPAYNAGGINTYTLTAVGTDASGRPVQSNTMTIGVDSMTIAVARSKPMAMADGNDSVEFVATIFKPTGEPSPDTDVSWRVQGSASITEHDDKTDTRGQARMRLVSNSVNSIRVFAEEPLGAVANTDAAFMAGPPGQLALSVAPATVPADGTSTSTLTATVTDDNGIAVGEGIEVAWSTSAGTLASSSTSTNAQGVATVVLTSSTTAGTANVSASAGAGSDTAAVTFTAGSAAGLALDASPSSITADGSSTSTLTATVTDTNGNPVPGTAVAWSTTAGTLASSSTSTNAQGVATV
ncbi:inverse autotransporter beta domain-containing protein, partial (plasmid) [Pseudomonas putida]